MEQPLSEFDLPEEEVAALESIFDKPVVAAAKSDSGKLAEYASLAKATRELPLRQRAFLRSMLANQMRPDVARRKLALAGIKIDHHATARWMKDPEFKILLDRYTQLMLDQAGIGSPSRILLRIDGVVEDALQPVPVIYQGLPVVDPKREGEYLMEVDRGSALKGLELLGKAAGAFRKDEENSARVTVVLDFSGEQMQGEQESEVIEGEVE